MLDKKSGTLGIDEGIEFGPNIDFNSIKNLQFGESSETIGTADAFVQKLKFKNVKIDNNYFIFRLSFELNRLFLLEIFISPIPFAFKKVGETGVMKKK